jgi:hypothetical protein
MGRIKNVRVGRQRKKSSFNPSVPNRHVFADTMSGTRNNCQRRVTNCGETIPFKIPFSITLHLCSACLLTSERHHRTRQTCAATLNLRVDFVPQAIRRRRVPQSSQSLGSPTAKYYCRICTHRREGKGGPEPPPRHVGGRDNALLPATMSSIGWPSLHCG